MRIEFIYFLFLSFILNNGFVYAKCSDSLESVLFGESVESEESVLFGEPVESSVPYVKEVPHLPKETSYSVESTSDGELLDSDVIYSYLIKGMEEYDNLEKFLNHLREDIAKVKEDLASIREVGLNFTFAEAGRAIKSMAETKAMIKKVDERAEELSSPLEKLVGQDISKFHDEWKNQDFNGIVTEIKEGLSFLEKSTLTLFENSVSEYSKAPSIEIEKNIVGFIYDTKFTRLIGHERIIEMMIAIYDWKTYDDIKVTVDGFIDRWGEQENILLMEEMARRMLELIPQSCPVNSPLQISDLVESAKNYWK